MLSCASLKLQVGARHLLSFHYLIWLCPLYWAFHLTPYSMLVKGQKIPFIWPYPLEHPVTRCCPSSHTPTLYSTFLAAGPFVGMGSLSWAGGHLHCTGAHRTLLPLHICTGCCRMAGTPRPPDKKRHSAHNPALPDLGVRHKVCWDTKYRAKTHRKAYWWMKRRIACTQIWRCIKKTPSKMLAHSHNGNDEPNDNHVHAMYNYTAIWWYNIK